MQPPMQGIVDFVTEAIGISLKLLASLAIRIDGGGQLHPF